MRPCDACGVEYVNAEAKKENEKSVYDPGEENERYCAVCKRKRLRDGEVKDFIPLFEAGRGKRDDDHLWYSIIHRLKTMYYDIPPLTQRPEDFNIFRNFKGSKDYFALVYADANNMGRSLEHYNTLDSVTHLLARLTMPVYTSVCTAIKDHLRLKNT